jgi:exopolysaccharide biosynthesis glucuronosyltransferase PssE
MIFVTVGTTAFPRLVIKMDEIAGRIDEKVIIQIGYTKYNCKSAECTEFIDYEDILDLFQQARITVCHDGVGTILTALQFDRPIIVVPRQKKYGEAYYDNKADVVKELVSTGRIRVINNIDELDSMLKNEDFTEMDKQSENQKSLINALSEYVNQIYTHKINRH